MISDWLLPIHLAATAVMTGVIWVVQLIQYPWFHRCPAETFPAYHRQYTERIGLIVGPAILVELLTGVALFLVSDGAVRAWFGWGLVLIGVNLCSTAFLQVPCHQRLSRGYDAAVHHRLVATNWIRTAAWSLRLVLVIAVSRG